MKSMIKILLLTLSSLISQEYGEPSRCTQSPDDLVFESNSFSISRPNKNWQFNRTLIPNRNATLVKVTLSEEAAQVTVIAEPLSSSNLDITQRRDAVLKTISGQQQYANATTFDTTLGGIHSPGIMVDQVSDTKSIRVQQCYVANQGLLYTVAIHSPRDKFQELLPTLTGIRNSFKFVKLSEETLHTLRVMTLARKCGSELSWATTWDAAAARARAKDKTLLVFIQLPVESPATNSGPLMDQDIIGMINAHCVPIRIRRGMDTPLHSYERYGIGKSSFGTTVLLTEPDGTVLGDLLGPKTIQLREFLIHQLSKRSREKNNPPRQGATKVARADRMILSGRLNSALATLDQPKSASDFLLRASIRRLQRNSEAAITELNNARQVDEESAEPSASVDEAVIRIRTGEYKEALTLLDSAERDYPDHFRVPEMRFWKGVSRSNLESTDAAKKVWNSLVADFPDTRWSWQAAGVMVRESFRSGTALSFRWPDPNVLEFLAVPRSEPFLPEQYGKAKRDAIAYLLKHQQADGSWRSTPAAMEASLYRTDSLTVAVTAICARGLIASHADPMNTDAIHKAVSFVRNWAVEENKPQHRPHLYDYSPWGYSYALRLFSTSSILELATPETLRPAVNAMINALKRSQMKGGGWNYRAFTVVNSTLQSTNQSASFMTATVLLALMEARAAGFEVPDDVVQPAVDCLYRMRNETESFEYFLSHDQEHRRPAAQDGSAGRGPVCSLALYKAGRIPIDDLRTSVKIFMQHRQSYARESGKSLMHAAPGGQGSHYLLFDYAWCAEAANELPESERAAFRQPLLQHVLETRLHGGSFVDNPINGTHYGAGMALEAIDLLAPL